MLNRRFDSNMDCFLPHADVSDSAYGSVATSPPATNVNYVSCQAYVQILFVEDDKWTPGVSGALIAYRTKNEFDPDMELYLSFFSGPRQRFLIKVSEIQKITKAHPNLIVIVHGKTTMGFNFAIEHVNRVDIFMAVLKPDMSPSVLAAKLKKAAENVSEEMKKHAAKIKNSFSNEPHDGNQVHLWLSESKQFLTRTLGNQKDTKQADRQRRLSDPTIYPKPISPSSVTIHDPTSPVKKKKPTKTEEMPKRSHSQSPPILKKTRSSSTTSGGSVVRRGSSKKRVTFSPVVQEWHLEQLQSFGATLPLRKRPEDMDKQSDIAATDVRTLISLWDSKF
uniref:Response regulatory domain-containing protein n=1 Tax=Panagrellus redivivus TaxID=6233 RepID=A0A7E4WDV4_PANRE